MEANQLIGLAKQWLVAGAFTMLGTVNSLTPALGTQAISFQDPANNAELSNRAVADGSASVIALTRIDDAAFTSTAPNPSVSLGLSNINMDIPVGWAQVIATTEEYVTFRIRRARFSGSQIVCGQSEFGHGDRDENLATPQARVIGEIKALSELTWPRIAELVGVERQTLYRWRRGEPADEQRLEHAVEVLGILNEAAAQYGNAYELRAWLNRRSPLEAVSPYQLIKESRFEEARVLAMLAPSNVTTITELGRNTSRWGEHIASKERAYSD